MLQISKLQYKNASDDQSQPSTSPCKVIPIPRLRTSPSSKVLVAADEERNRRGEVGVADGGAILPTLADGAVVF